MTSYTSATGQLYLETYSASVVFVLRSTDVYGGRVTLTDCEFDLVSEWDFPSLHPSETAWEAENPSSMLSFTPTGNSYPPPYLMLSEKEYDSEPLIELDTEYDVLVESDWDPETALPYCISCGI